MFYFFFFLSFTITIIISINVKCVTKSKINAKEVVNGAIWKNRYHIIKAVKYKWQSESNYFKNYFYKFFIAFKSGKPTLTAPASSDGTGKLIMTVILPRTFLFCVHKKTFLFWDEVNLGYNSFQTWAKKSVPKYRFFIVINVIYM